MEELEPKDQALVATIKSMNERGIKTLYGRWLIDGAPRVLLFDTATGYGYLDEWKGDLWSSAGIPSPPGDSETNEAIVFGYLIAWFLGEVRLTRSSNNRQVPQGVQSKDPLQKHVSSAWPWFLDCTSWGTVGVDRLCTSLRCC